jgi:hypothetical protein
MTDIIIKSLSGIETKYLKKPYERWNSNVPRAISFTAGLVRPYDHAD